MKLNGLIIDSATGQCSHTKLWSNIAYLAATIVFLRWGVLSEQPPSEWMWLIYLGVVGGHTVLSKLVSLKYAKQEEKA